VFKVSDPVSLQPTHRFCNLLYVTPTSKHNFFPSRAKAYLLKLDKKKSNGV